MVTSFLQGGLGNQLFQVATAYNIAKKNSDYAEFNFNNSHTPLQGNNVSKYKNNIFKEFKHSDNILIENFFYQKGHAFENIEYKKNLQINGYFQSEKFFIENKEDIVKKFKVGIKSEILKYENVMLFLASIKNNGKPLVSIHVRRGDYLRFPHIHPVCSLDYYKKSMEIIKNKVGEVNFLFVSDDKHWIKENFESLGIISPFNDDIEDLILLSNSDHNIIANSSFSWWGAYLNENRNKIIIAPKTWFGISGPQDQEDTIPNEWIKI